MTELDQFGRNYLRLTLEIDKHLSGYVDAYYGPAALRDSVKSAPRRPTAELLDEVERLKTAVPTANPARERYLRATLRALECTVSLLNGAQIDYLEEVSRLYDIQPRPVDEALFEAAHGELETLLPGTGTLAERLNTRRQHYEVDKSQLLSLLELTRAETQRRTRALVDLPPDESVEVTLASGQPWGAYNWYLGGGRSHIEFNTDTPVSALGIVSTFAHEGYPGHHTEALLKERLLYHARGHAEQGAMLLHSPAAVIAEGIANTAVEIIFPDGTEHDWTIDVLLPEAGIEALETAVEMRRIAAALKNLRYVSGNAAILYHRGRLTRAQTIDYIQTYAIATPERAEKSFSFLSHPLFRSYIFTYTQGYDLIVDAAGGNKLPLMRRLLTEQVLPSELKTLANA